MDYPVNEITILTNDEFLLLLAASGLEQWYGIELTDQRAALNDVRSFNSVLASLYQKGVVEWQGEKAEIAPAYKGMFRTLRDASTCILIKKADTPDNVKGCYSADGLVTCIERSTVSGDDVELSAQYPDEWLSELVMSGCLPESTVEPEAEEVPLGSKELLSEFELRSVPEGDLIRAMRIYEQGLFTIMEIESGAYVKREFLRPGDAESVLSGWCGGKL